MSKSGIVSTTPLPIILSQLLSINFLKYEYIFPLRNKTPFQTTGIPEVEVGTEGLSRKGYLENRNILSSSKTFWDMYFWPNSTLLIWHVPLS